MTDSKVIIKDATSLVRLKESLDICGDSLLKLLQEIDGYLKMMLQQFEGQRDYFKKSLEQAEQLLREAEQSLSDCESSQTYDEEDKCYYPCCDSQKDKVEDTKKYYSDCKEKYDKVCSIVSDCKHEIEEYKFRGGILRPNGGECQLEYIADGHTKEAIRKMDEIIEVVEEYLGRPLAETNPNDGLTGEQVQKFQEASEKVKDKQKSEAASNNIADAYAAMVCVSCKRPIPICICARTRVLVR